MEKEVRNDIRPNPEELVFQSEGESRGASLQNQHPVVTEPFERSEQTSGGKVRKVSKQEHPTEREGGTTPS
jgi:hypothetical protein